MAFTVLLINTAACSGQQTKEISKDDLHIRIDQDSLLSITYQDGASIESGTYVVHTEEANKAARVEFNINNEHQPDGLVQFYSAGNILFKKFSVENGLLHYMNHYDVNNGRLQDSIYFAMAEIPVFEDQVPTWQNLHVQHQRSYFNNTNLTSLEIIYDQRVVLKTTFDESRKTIELCTDIYQKMYRANGEVSSIKSYDWGTKLEKYEQYNQQGTKVIEVLQSDLHTGRVPYEGGGTKRTPNEQDFYQRTTYYDNGKPEQIEYFKAGKVTITHYDSAGKETKKTSDSYDTLPRLTIL
ncbi:hypothetical protein DC487_05570 [Sphingobacterium corticibacter]|uniref:Uncharacterized protein n=2 Tax=Sphingobacterium corticibacter TaxID=2171749 RepID=A0A2T8HNR0_9SPHI|nr:hypothetical protein DC487_05570 [Sphingobacterium corticibacter]